MKRLAAALLAGTILTAPVTSMAADAVYFDGASPLISHDDPYFHPLLNPVTGETGARYFVLNFQYSSIGQANDGYVVPWEVIFPDNQYEASVRLEFIDSDLNTGQSGIVGDGVNCPTLKWAIDHGLGNNDDGTLDAEQWNVWNEEFCGQRPDPALYNSGAAMGLRLSVADGYGPGSHWMLMQSDNVLPQDGKWYDVEVFVSTGGLIQGPWAVFLVTPKFGPPGTLSSFVYIDSSYYYASIPDGFSIPLGGAAHQGGEQPMFWQVGCTTRDPLWVSSCYTGALGTIFFYPSTSEVEIIPYGSTAARFLTDNYTAADLGLSGTNPFGKPPEVYQTGDDVTFVYNEADIAAPGVHPVQTFTIEGWSYDGSNPFYTGLGAGMQVNATDPF